MLGYGGRLSGHVARSGPGLGNAVEPRYYCEVTDAVHVGAGVLR